MTLTLNVFAPADRASEASRAVANGARLSRPESAARAARRAALDLDRKFSQTRQLHGCPPATDVRHSSATRSTMHFNAATATRRPSLRHHLTHAKHAGQTGNPAHQNQEICAPRSR